eukprot:5031870-Amphidinium_carterae.1
MRSEGERLCRNCRVTVHRAHKTIQQLRGLHYNAVKRPCVHLANQTRAVAQHHDSVKLLTLHPCMGHLHSTPFLVRKAQQGENLSKMQAAVNTEVGHLRSDMNGRIADLQFRLSLIAGCGGQ